MGGGQAYVFGEEKGEHDDCSCYYAQQCRNVSCELGTGRVAPADSIAHSCGCGDTCEGSDETNEDNPSSWGRECCPTDAERDGIQN